MEKLFRYSKLTGKIINQIFKIHFPRTEYFKLFFLFLPRVKRLPCLFWLFGCSFPHIGIIHDVVVTLENKIHPYDNIFLSIVRIHDTTQYLMTEINVHV